MGEPGLTARVRLAPAGLLPVQPQLPGPTFVSAAAADAAVNERLLEAANGLGFVVEDLEDGVKLCNLQQVLYAL